MRTTHNILFSGVALAALLPAVALAQDATTDTTVTEVPVETIETDDTIALEGEAVETEMGVTDVEVTSAEPMDLSTWTYDDLYANGISIEQMIGSDVYGPEGDDIGDVENVLFNMDGQVLSVVAEIGGFLDIGDTHVNIPWEMVSAENWADGIVIPFTEDEVENYIADASYYGTSDEFYGANDGLLGDEAALGTEVAEGQELVTGDQQIAEVGGDGAGQVETGPNVWRAGDLLNNTARLRDGEAYANYGMVSDIVVRDGQIAAVLVTSDGAYGGTAGGLYGYPYAGQAGWNRGMAEGEVGTYDLPYDRTQAEMVQPFDPAMLAD